MLRDWDLSSFEHLMEAAPKDLIEFEVGPLPQRKISKATQRMLATEIVSGPLGDFDDFTMMCSPKPTGLYVWLWAASSTTAVETEGCTEDEYEFLGRIHAHAHVVLCEES